VEPPGTAPGSEPLITGAFIAIVWVTPSRANIGMEGRGGKDERAVDGADYLAASGPWGDGG
jgi:hypothetical protein